MIFGYFTVYYLCYQSYAGHSKILDMKSFPLRALIFTNYCHLFEDNDFFIIFSRLFLFDGNDRASTQTRRGANTGRKYNSCLKSRATCHCSHRQLASFVELGLLNKEKAGEKTPTLAATHSESLLVNHYRNKVSLLDDYRKYCAVLAIDFSYTLRQSLCVPSYALFLLALRPGWLLIQARRLNEPTASYRRHWMQSACQSMYEFSTYQRLALKPAHWWFHYRRQKRE